jgi:hypothetical protein
VHSLKPKDSDGYDMQRECLGRETSRKYINGRSVGRKRIRWMANVMKDIQAMKIV